MGVFRATDVAPLTGGASSLTYSARVEGGRVVVKVAPPGLAPVLNRDVLRQELAPVFADLNRYDATMHFVGQSTILSLTTDKGTGETYCLAHHLTIAGEKRRLMIAALRYCDTFVKVEGEWLFAERLLYVDWIQERVLA